MSRYSAQHWEQYHVAPHLESRHAASRSDGLGMFWWRKNWPKALPWQLFGNCCSRNINIYRLVRLLAKRESETTAGVRNASLATGSWPVAENFHEVLEDLSWPMADESVADDFHEEPHGRALAALACGRRLLSWSRA